MDPRDATIAEIQAKLDEIEVACKQLKELFDQSRAFREMMDGLKQAAAGRQPFDPAVVQQIHCLTATYNSAATLFQHAPRFKELRSQLGRVILAARFEKAFGRIRSHP